MPSPDPQTLAELLPPHFPPAVPEWGRWAWLAGQLRVTPASVSEWLARDVVPARRIDALCELLRIPDDLRAELRRRAGFQALPVQGPAGDDGEGDHAQPLP